MDSAPKAKAKTAAVKAEAAVQEAAAVVEGGYVGSMMAAARELQCGEPREWAARAARFASQGRLTGSSLCL